MGILLWVQYTTHTLVRQVTSKILVATTAAVWHIITTSIIQTTAILWYIFDSLITGYACLNKYMSCSIRKEVFCTVKTRVCLCVHLVWLVSSHSLGTLNILHYKRRYKLIWDLATSESSFLYGRVILFLFNCMIWFLTKYWVTSCCSLLIFRINRLHFAPVLCDSHNFKHTMLCILKEYFLLTEDIDSKQLRAERS